MKITLISILIVLSLSGCAAISNDRPLDDIIDITGMVLF